MTYLIIAEAILVLFVMWIITSVMMEKRHKMPILQAVVTWVVCVVIATAIINLVIAAVITVVGVLGGLTSSVAMTVYSMMQ